MTRALVPLCAALLLLSAACDGGSDDPPPPSVSPTHAESDTPGAAGSCEPGFSPLPGGVDATITSGGVERTYILHVPDAYTGTRRAPLVVLYHGFSSDADSIAEYTGFLEAAGAQGVAVAVPDALGAPSRWNDNSDVTVADDVQFTRDLLAALREQICIDEERVFAAGFSNGGGMAQVVACEMPEVFAAIGTVAATYNICMAGVPWVAIHGIEDPLVPFDGGENPPERGGGVFYPARRVLSEWARELGCDGLGQISRESSEVERTTYVRCRRGDGEVLLYAIIGGGHTWPGAAALPVDVVGHTTKQLDATAAILEFFASHPAAP